MVTTPLTEESLHAKVAKLFNLPMEEVRRAIETYQELKESFPPGPVRVHLRSEYQRQNRPIDLRNLPPGMDLRKAYLVYRRQQRRQRLTRELNTELNPEGINQLDSE